MRARTLGVVAILALACGGPVGPIPGGALSGTLKRAPASWAFVEPIEQVQLETNPDDPHSVNTWIGTHAGALYLPTSMIRGPKLPTEREWVRNIERDDRVRLRIDDSLYELRAVRVLDEAEATAARTALEKKYALSPSAQDPTREIWLFRLVPR